MDRPQRLDRLTASEQSHLANVIIWRQNLSLDLTAAHLPLKATSTAFINQVIIWTPCSALLSL